jgi:hypothetical protein
LLARADDRLNRSLHPVSIPRWSFIDSCENCRALTYYGGRVENESIVEIWPIEPRILSEERLIASRMFGDD